MYKHSYIHSYPKLISLVLQLFAGLFHKHLPSLLRPNTASFLAVFVLNSDEKKLQTNSVDKCS